MSPAQRVRRALTALAVLAGAVSSPPAWAHLGSPDVFYDGKAGPYRLLVTVRPAEVVPGVADVEVRVLGGDVRQLRLVPLPLNAQGARFAPTADVAERDRLDPRFFRGHLWMMATGSWQIRLTANGEQGEGVLFVPVPALPLRVSPMQPALGALLAMLLGVLALGLVSIAGAAAREGTLAPGALPSTSERRRARRWMAGAGLLLVAAFLGGGAWWSSEARIFRAQVYKPLAMKASVGDGGRLTLELADPGWLRWRHVDDFLPDHGHPMHLFAVRWPKLDGVLHLHPDPGAGARFSQTLPSVTGGHYRLFADVVHENGLPETLVAEADLPTLTGRPFEGDDAGGDAPARFDPSRTAAPLGAGGRMVWLRDAAPLRARVTSTFRFRVEDAQGRPDEHLELYMGMLGHAAIVRTDGSVFAHIHPSGSVPMASLGAAARVNGVGDAHAGHVMDALPAEVSFPFGLPQPGDYRIFVQVKRAGRVETASFDARAEP